MFTVAGIASFPRLSLHCLHEARGYLDLLSPYLENSKFPSQGCTKGGRRRKKKKVVETSEDSPFSSRGLEYSAVLLSDETDSKKI